MKSISLTQRLTVLFSIGALFVAGAFAAEGGSFDQKAAEVLDKFVQASGGVEAMDKIENRHTVGKMEIPAQNLTMRIESWSARPNKTLQKASSEMLGTMVEGGNGEIFWERSVMTGARVLEGTELDAARLEAQFDKYAHWREVFDTVAYLGEDSVSGNPCHKIMVNTTGGKDRTLFIDQNSYLLVKIEQTLQHQMGDIPMEVYMQDYREVDGVQMPFRNRSSVMGQEMVIQIDSVTHNIDMPEDMFAVPEDIKELMPAETGKADE
jgi:hypothetical protein